MVKHSEEPQNETQDPSQEVRQTTDTQTRQTKQPLLVALTCLLSIVALAVSTYALFITNGAPKNLINAQNTLSSQIEALNKGLTNAQEQLDAKTQIVVTTQNELNNKLSQLEQQVLSSINKSDDQKAYRSKKWLLFKAVYYLEAAQINTDWTSNFNTSIALLEQADSVLKEFNDPKLQAVREAISREMAQLKAIHVLDKASLLGQLETAQRLVEKLSVTTKNNSQAEPLTANPASIPAWRVQWQDSLKSLEKLVVIRQNEEAVKPLLSPFLSNLLKESLYLALQQAQWAILNNQSKVFELSINQALTTLNRGFNEQDSNTQALINQLKSLRSIPFPQEKPTTGLALSLLNQWLSTDDSRKN